MPGRGELASTSSARCNLKLASARATGCRPAWGHTTLRGTRGGGALEVTRRDCDVAWVHGDRGGTGVSTLELGGSGPAQKRRPPLRQVLAWLSSTFASKRASVSEFSSTQVRPWQAAPENGRSETRRNADSVGVFGFLRAVGGGRRYLYPRRNPAISRESQRSQAATPAGGSRLKLSLLIA